MKQKQEKLETKMKWMLLSTMIPMTILIIVLLVFFWHYTNEYNQLSNNLAVSSEYNANYRNSNNDMSFKDEVDMDIYYVTIGRKGKDGLPTEQVDKAISTVESLKKTTSKKESLRSLKYLTNYLENLKKRMNQLLEIKNYQERQEFVANVSHDFRSPLTSIKGYVEAMTDGTIPPELHEKYLKIILFETERLTDLTQDLLTLNEFDTNHLLLNREVFDIHEMIKHVAASFEGVCTQKKISIELVFATKHLNVNADKRKIQQVLYNLLDNAIKFSDPNSIVTIETTDRGEKVYTSVKDNGMGIPRSALGKIWERFYKSDLSRGKDKKGTGLGLAIVKEAIQAHGENITVVSTEGVGTEFSFSLPKVAG